MTLRIKNWAKHQHFKDRTPPWIKLYRDILDDPDWHELDGESAKILVSLWLIASEDDTHTGALPDSRRLAFRLRIKESQLNSFIVKLSHWLIRNDIETISGGYRSDAPETETETETEKIAKTGVADSSTSNPAGANSVQTSQPEDCPQSQILALYAELLPMARQPRDWTTARQALLRARWREAKNRQNLDWWKALFAYIAKSKFLTGQSNTPGRKPFELGLDWLLKAENFAKVREGAYHDAQDVEETA